MASPASSPYLMSPQQQAMSLSATSPPAYMSQDLMGSPSTMRTSPMGPYSLVPTPGSPIRGSVQSITVTPLVAASVAASPALGTMPYSPVAMTPRVYTPPLAGTPRMPSPPPLPTTLEIIANTPQLSLLYSLLTTPSVDLASQLGTETYTLFAPTNTALETALANRRYPISIERLMQFPATIRAILMMQITSAAVSADTLTASGQESMTVTAIDGVSELTLERTGQAFTITRTNPEFTPRSAQLEATVLTRNGIVHMTSNML